MSPLLCKGASERYDRFIDGYGCNGDAAEFERSLRHMVFPNRTVARAPQDEPVPVSRTRSDCRRISGHEASCENKIDGRSPRSSSLAKKVRVN